MITREKNLEKQVKIWCGQQNYLCYHLEAGTYQLANGRWLKIDLPVGWPDLTIFHDGKVSFCELKVGYNKQSKEQIEIMNMLKKRGYNVIVAYSLEEFINGINSI